MKLHNRLVKHTVTEIQCACGSSEVTVPFGISGTFECQFCGDDDVDVVGNSERIVYRGKRIKLQRQLSVTPPYKGIEHY